MTERLLHHADHALLGLAVFEAGRSLTKHRRSGLLLLAAVLFIRTHRYHHGRVG